MRLTVDGATLHELRYLKMMEELQNSAEIEVFSETIEIDDEENHSLGEPLTRRAEDFSLLAREQAHWEDIVVDPAITECGLRFFEIGSYWRSSKSRSKVTGEFFLQTFFDVILSSPPNLAWKGEPESERLLYSEFRIIDSHPKSGTGLLAAVRIQPNKTPLEIWVWDPRVGPKRMDVDYCGYLDALLLTKGVYGWQYLFTDVSLADGLFYHTAAGLKASMEILPVLFPQYDYTSLMSRLEERL